MDKKTIFIKTAKGEDEFRSETSHLSGDIKRVLGLVDDVSTVDELLKRAAPSLRKAFDDMLQELVQGGFIVDKSKAGSLPRIARPATTRPADTGGDLDFTHITSPPARDAELSARKQADADRARAEREAIARAEAEAARIKTEQEAVRARERLAKEQAEKEARARQQAEAERTRIEHEKIRAKAEHEEARIRAEQEAARTREKVEAEAKERADASMRIQLDAAREIAATPSTQSTDGGLAVPEDEEARQLAEEQAKVWADAEQRAREQAAARTEKAGSGQQPVPPPARKSSPEVVRRETRVARKPLPWAKMAGGVSVLALILAWLLPYVWPMQEYISAIEQRLSAQLRQPVHVGFVRATLLPLPRLEMREIAIGPEQALKVASATLNFDIPSLFGETRIIRSAELAGLEVSAQAFGSVLSWMRNAGGDANYPVGHMILRNARINTDGFSLPVVNGTVDFDGNRQVLKAALSSEDGKFEIRLQPEQSRWRLELAVRNGSLPLLPEIQLGELNASGEVADGWVNLNAIDGRLYGGGLRGNARLTWSGGWQMTGKLGIKNMALREAIPQLDMEGEVDAGINFALRGAQFRLLNADPQLEGNFSVKKGYISNIDMVETARVSGRSGAAAGRTHFDELSGLFEVRGGSQHWRQIRIAAGVMNANGSVDVAPDRKLSGRMNVELKVRSEMGSLPLTLTGTPAGREWRVGR